jgi:hypothetical protein
VAPRGFFEGKFSVVQCFKHGGLRRIVLALRATACGGSGLDPAASVAAVPYAP